MTPRARKRLFRLIGLPILILLILIGIAIALLFTQQQRLVRLAVSDLNEKFPGRLEVNGSEISVFQHFPYISIGLQNVKFFPIKPILQKLFLKPNAFIPVSASLISSVRNTISRSSP